MMELTRWSSKGDIGTSHFADFELVEPALTTQQIGEGLI